jgi:chorismate mutase / prephenate dehydrogenase
MGTTNLAQPRVRAANPASRQVRGDTNTPATSALETARAEIDAIDSRLVSLIAERARLARKIGRAKRSLGMVIEDPPREAAVVRRAAELARECGVEPEAVRTIFWQLIALSRTVQRDQP